MRSALMLIPCALIGFVLVSCAQSHGTGTTRMTVDDLDYGTTEVSQKLLDSDFLASRDASSEPIIVAVNRVLNLTSDVIPEGEQWLWIQRVRTHALQSGLSRQKQIWFVIPKQFEAEGKASGEIEANAFAARAPTHEMTATLHSLTRSGQQHRTDAYISEFRITDISTGSLVWTDEVEFKRVARGRSYN
ncbi:MAG: hypothetical protein H6815_05940 [Phycisphaeraceae bacterium]|nr:hypothetical protein [Phycisphaerales bacterium]MCB9859980.1 hypothetical protein [Phycisphaeraceae bacterium]